MSVPVESRLDGLQILRGADIVEEGAWNHSLPIDGGNITISARAPDHDTWSTTIEVGREGDSKSVVVPKLKRSPIRVPSRRARLPFVLGGARVVLLGSALGFELHAERTYNKSKVEPDVVQQHSLWHSANTERYLAEGLAVGGLVCAGFAVWRFIRHGTIESTTVGVVPLVDRNQAGLQLVGHY